ncbi:hypothetical protein [Achromobacter aloeverae]|uniref:Uncharacterized protein n=1 Tax=Achromobacter aloeverae TaxID=1750518 RepID=A0A4Q1HLG0_9BURK|nr:hypothetical protein [Achromobacter aloeverae]RXN91086.1 hypothetical protein C7R54_07795 [Achromobacter aloeverae]
MALDGEPKDGDYVRYVERLVNRGAPPPGQVIAQDAAGGAKEHDAALSPGEVGRPASRRPAQGSSGATARTGTRAYPAGSPARDPAPDNGQANAMRTGAEAGPAPSLAARSAQRKISAVILVVALLIAWHAVRLILGAVDDGNVDVSALMPGVFLLAFALMVYGISRNIRRNADRPAAKLPPLTTVSGNKPGQGNRPR